MVNRKICIAEFVFDHKGYSGYYSIYRNNSKESSGTFESAEELSFGNVQPDAVMLSGNIVMVREIEAGTSEEALRKIAGLGIEAEQVFVSWHQVSSNKGFLAIADKNRCHDLFRELEENRIRPRHFLIAPFFLRMENGICDTGTWAVMFAESKLQKISKGSGRIAGDNTLAQQLCEVLKNRQDIGGRISIPEHETLLKEKQVEQRLFRVCLLLGLLMFLLKFSGNYFRQSDNDHAGQLIDQTAEQDSIQTRITESREKIKALGLRRSLNSAKVIDKISATLPAGIKFRDLKMITAEDNGELEICGDCKDRLTFSEWLSTLKLSGRSVGSEQVTAAPVSEMNSGLQFVLKIEL